jgi:hypothetical protein
MIEMTAIVAAQHPKLQVSMQGRVGAQETPKQLGHLSQLLVGEDAVDPAVEPPD